MPVISLEIAPVGTEKKEELIKNLTKIASEITNISESSFVVLIKEYPLDAIGVGGIPLTDIFAQRAKNQGNSQ